MRSCWTILFHICTIKFTKITKNALTMFLICSYDFLDKEGQVSDAQIQEIIKSLAKLRGLPKAKSIRNALPSALVVVKPS